MQLLTHFKAATDGVATSMLSASPIATPAHTYQATANRASKRTAWYSAFGAAATWSLIG